MLNILMLICGSLLLGYVLLIRRANACRTLSAWRWMLFTWGVLGLFAVTSPFTFEDISVSLSTIVYCVAWLVLFVLGDIIGFRGNRREKIYRTQFWDRKRLLRLCKVLLGLSAVGAAIYARMTLSTLGQSSPMAVLQELRDNLAGADQSAFRTIVQICAFAGLPAALVLVCRSIALNKKVPVYSWIGAAAAVSVYVVSAGRQGLVFTGISLLVVIVSSLQLRSEKYRYVSHIYRGLLVVFALFAVYFAANVVTRSTGGIDATMDDKLKYVNRLVGCRIDPGFRESVRPLGAVGDTFIELYLYFSTQMSGLDATLKHYEGPHFLGLEQTPYFTRRIESLTGVDILSKTYSADAQVFADLGMAPNFFRTAAHSMFLSFGQLGALPVMFFSGLVAGMCRRLALRRYSPYFIALQALICSGAAFTIVYSPLPEAGWAFPMLWMLVLPLTVSSHKSTAAAEEPGCFGMVSLEK